MAAGSTGRRSFVWLLTFIPTVREVGHVSVSIPWVPQLGFPLDLSGWVIAAF